MAPGTPFFSEWVSDAHWLNEHSGGTLPATWADGALSKLDGDFDWPTDAGIFDMDKIPPRALSDAATPAELQTLATTRPDAIRAAAPQSSVLSRIARYTTLLEWARFAQAVGEAALQGTAFLDGARSAAAANRAVWLDLLLYAFNPVGQPPVPIDAPTAQKIVASVVSLDAPPRTCPGQPRLVAFRAALTVLAQVPAARLDDFAYPGTDSGPHPARRMADLAGHHPVEQPAQGHPVRDGGGRCRLAAERPLEPDRARVHRRIHPRPIARSGRRGGGAAQFRTARRAGRQWPRRHRPVVPAGPSRALAGERGAQRPCAEGAARRPLRTPVGRGRRRCSASPAAARLPRWAEQRDRRRAGAARGTAGDPDARVHRRDDRTRRQFRCAGRRAHRRGGVSSWSAAIRPARWSIWTTSCAASGRPNWRSPNRPSSALGSPTGSPPWCRPVRGPRGGRRCTRPAPTPTRSSTPGAGTCSARPRPPSSPSGNGERPAGDRARRPSTASASPPSTSSRPPPTRAPS